MDPPASLPRKSLTKPTFACIRCSERKVRCNKLSPCNACVRHNVQCIFRPPKPSRRKQNLVEDELVKDRLERYGTSLQEKGLDPNRITASSEAELHHKSTRLGVQETVRQLPIQAPIVSEPQATVFKPQLLHGQSGTKLVDNSLWSRLAEEIHEAKDAQEEDSPNDASDDGMTGDDFAYVIGCETSITVSLHPPPNLIRQLWKTFIENVNPLTKLVHIPSLQLAIEKAITNIKDIPRGFEALMFSIYSMAVLSLTDDECKEMLGESQVTLLPRYVAATKAALLRARFMSSTSIVVMQALVLHILSIRDVCESRAVWSLTGLAIRVAEGIGMRLDGTLLGLSPFETEIRRRIWWQLKMHDFRAAELCGQAKFRDFDLDETTPKKPANVNDSDLYPTMTQAAAESTKPTEMIWFVLRTELASFAAAQKAKIHKLGKVGFTSEEYAAVDDLKMKDNFIAEIEDMIETKFLRFCDPSEPLQLWVLLGARMATDLIRFIAHHPRRWALLDQVPASEQHLVWGIVLQLLERYNMMQSSPHLRRFAWNVPYFIQWHAVIHVLDTLRIDPLHADAAKAWRLIDNIYEMNSKILLSTNKQIFVAVGNLCLKAFSARATALTKEGKRISDPPEYITKLQEQRKGAKARREAVLISSRGKEIFGCEKRSAAKEADLTWPDTDPRLADAMVEAQSQQDPVARQPANPVQGSLRIGDDAFWLGDALDDEFFASGAADTMDLEMDAALAQDDWLDTPNDELIDWAQWDAWFGNADLIRPNIGAGPG